MPAPAYCQPLAYRTLQRAMPVIEHHAGLVRAACAIAAHDQVELKDQLTLDALDALVATIRKRSPSSTQNALLANLHDLLFDVWQLRGNTDDYYNPANSYLPSVVETKRGIPITLSLIYYYVASELGLTAYGVNAPGHFMVAVQTSEAGQESMMFVDPFYGGTLLSMPEAFERIAMATGSMVEPDPRQLAPATHPIWLRRMILNLTAIFARAGRERDLHAMQELLNVVEGDYV